MKILVQDNEGIRALEEGFASEEELQTFLREHADLMPLEEIELGTPPLLCIGCEVGVASGAQDILYIDQNGLLTVVETKLRKNPEARREVVGQILEYAAQMSAWTPADVERQAQRFFAGKSCPQAYQGSTLEHALQIFFQAHQLVPGFSYEGFLQQVQTNIERGQFRLIIAIDEPPDPLLITVEFVNRFSERFEMYLIQLKRFRDITQDQNIFVPALFGRVASVQKKRLQGPLWDRERFLAQADVKAPQCKSVLHSLIAFAEQEHCIVWGKGASVGSFQFVIQSPDLRSGRKSVSAFFVMANGRMSFDFWTLANSLDAKIIEAYRADLGIVEQIPREAVDTLTWKEFDVAALGADKALAAFKRAVVGLKATTSPHDP